VLTGRLEQPIVLEKLVAESRDGAGQPEEKWIKFADAWAQFTPITVGERFIGERVAASESATFKIRYRPDLDPSPKRLRIRFLEKIWNVTGLQLVGRFEGWLVTAEIAELEGTEQGIDP
jgi:head-tail adaptor